MTNPVRWGILGCGRIARKFASDLRLVNDGLLVAVGSRSAESARSFISEFPARFAHDSYEALVANPEVDIIYVASPHGLHHEHTLLCLEHGKAVLCEKAFAINSRQAREMVDSARSKKLFLMEALWTRFMPHFNKVMQMIRGGELGELQSVLVNFGFLPQPPIPARLWDPALGGGTLLDIGIYNVFIALSALGRPDVIEASMTPSPTGVDAQCAVLFRYNSGAMAQLFSSFNTNLATEADIAGTKGRIRLTPRFYEPSATIEYYTGRIDTRQVIPFDKEDGWGYQYEIRHVHDCLQQGIPESPLLTLDDSLFLMEMLDAIRNVAGIRYPVD